MKNRFDLESEILSLHSFCDDLSILAEQILEGQITEDEIVNVILGMSKMMEMRQNVLFDTFCQVHKLDDYFEDFDDEEVNLDEEIEDEQTAEEPVSVLLFIEINDEGNDE